MKRRSLFSCIGLITVLTITGVPRLWAQSAAETLQQKVGLPQQVSPPTPTTTSTQDLGTIGIVQKFPKPDMFTVSTTQQYFHTDNVFYSQAGQVGSSAYLGTYTASYVPYSFVNWTPRITAQYNMARYGNAAAGDFDNENLAFSSQYIFSKDRSWSWTSTINLSRFTAPHSNNAVFYKEVVYDNQINRVMPIGKNNNLFFIAGYDLAYHQASPSVFDRLDNTLSFSLSYYPCKELCIGPYIRPSARTYVTDTATQNGRDDFNLSEGLDITYQPCKYVALSADISNTNDFSNTAGQSYNVTSPGVSVTGTYKF
jgi:hypothetical protein